MSNLIDNDSAAIASSDGEFSGATYTAMAMNINYVMNVDNFCTCLLSANAATVTTYTTVTSTMSDVESITTRSYASIADITSASTTSTNFPTLGSSPSLCLNLVTNGAFNEGGKGWTEADYKLGSNAVTMSGFTIPGFYESNPYTWCVSCSG